MNYLTALENVMIPALLNNFKNKVEIEKEAKELLEIVGLAERIKHKPNQLSGGEKQRVAIARAMINKPKLILADEPTGSLDPKMAEIVFELIKYLRDKYNKTVIIVTHDISLANKADFIVDLSEMKK